MNRCDLKFSKGDVIVYKDTGEEFIVSGIQDEWVFGRKSIHRFNYILLDRYDIPLSYHWDFVEKAFDYKKEMVVVEKEEYDFATTLMEYSM